MTVRAPVSRRRPAPRFVVLTGLSGSGKSQAIRALEDLGYFCVDNLPTTLIPTLADLVRREGIPRVAIVVDIREKSFLAEFPKMFRKLRAMKGLGPALIFLEATNAALVRRFSETRRPHPLAPDRPVSEGIQDERERLKAIRQMADQIIDTSELTVHELRNAFSAFSLEKEGQRARLVVTLVSFGFKHGIPVDADLVFDVRFLPNPNYIPAFKDYSGKHPSVARYIRSFPQTTEFIERISELLIYLLPHYIAEGKSYLTISFGCTGGHHRSVLIASESRKRLAAAGFRVKETHRDVKK